MKTYKKTFFIFAGAMMILLCFQHAVILSGQSSSKAIISYNFLALSIGLFCFILVLYLLTLHTRRKLHRLAYYDALTGEMNISMFKSEAQKIMSHKDKSYAIMVTDIDKFKSINDLYGYEFGDQVLILVAKVLRQNLLPNSILCHGNADKFYYFFEYKNKEFMHEQFSTLTAALNQAAAKELPNCSIILSCGICIIQDDDMNIISIMDRANIAAKQVKSYHKSSFSFYDPAMSNRINQTRILESKMADALQNEEFIVYLQPKIDLATNKIAGAEALVRWQYPDTGLMSPIEFIPLFEENGFIVNLDFYMLEHVCQLLEKWKKEGKKLFPISVNLSRRHLFIADTANQLSEIVSRYDVEPSLIEVELTESAFDNCDIPSINTLFDALHKKGFHVSVDDFGAGYSSLSLLKDLSIDVLKIDKSFFSCGKEESTSKIEILLESVISLSRRLNIKTVSEGVETKQQVALLLQLGCDLVQGYYFAKPMPVTQLEKLLEEGRLPIAF